MRNRLRFICALALLASSTAMASEVGYRYDNQNDEVVIEGNLDCGAGRVSLQIYNREAFETYAPDGVVTAENIDAFLVYSKQGYTNEDGSFLFSFPLKEASDSYIARIGAASMEKAIDYGFFYTDPDEEVRILTQLRGKKTAEALMEYVEGDTPEAINTFNPDPVYANIGDKLAIFKRLVTKTDYETLSDFSALFVTETRLQEVNEITDADTLLAKLIAYNSLSKVADAPFYTKTYTDVLTDGQKAEILSDIIAHSDFDSFEALYQYMGKQIVLCAVDHNDWYVVMQAMQDNEEFFEEEILEKFSKTEAKREKAAKAVAGKSFSNWTSFESAIEDAFKEKKNNQSSGGGGGGGGSSAGTIIGGGVQIPIVTPPTTIKEQKMPFEDLSGYEWASPSIEALWKKAVVSGASEKEYLPAKAVTREEFVAMIVRNFNLMNEKAECDFADIAKDDWCYRAVASACKAGIVFGVDETNFGKGSEITRQDMCVIAHRAAEKAGVIFSEKTELPFTDEISDYAKEQICVLYANGIINGFDETTFGALEQSNRAQAAVVIHKINEYMAKED